MPSRNMPRMNTISWERNRNMYLLVETFIIHAAIACGMRSHERYMLNPQAETMISITFAVERNASFMIGMKFRNFRDL